MKNPPTSINYRPIVIPKATLDRLLKTEKPYVTISLYTFYYYTAIWQKSNQIKCVESYVKKGLGLGRDSFRKAKKQLIELGLVRNVQRRNKKNKDGKYVKPYIRVCFYEGALPEGRKLPSGFIAKKTQTVEKRPVGKQPTNTYSTNSKNAYSTGTVASASTLQQRALLNTTKKVYTKQTKLSILLFKAIPSHLKNKPNKLPKKNATTGKRNWSYWAREFKKLLDVYTYKDIKKTLLWYANYFEDRYTPQRCSAKTFCEDYYKILRAMDRQTEDARYENMSAAERAHMKQKEAQDRYDTKHYMSATEFKRKYGKLPF